MATMPSIATSEAARKPSVTNPWLRRLAVTGLVAIGLALLILASIALFDTQAPGANSVNKTSTTSAVAPPTGSGGKTTTTVLSTETTTPGKTSVRSESVAAALFGLGSILFLVGVFFGRIQEVTLPGGGGVKLISPEVKEAVTEKVAEKVKQDPNIPENPETAIALYEATLNQLIGMRQIPPSRFDYGAPLGAAAETSPGDDVLDIAVDRAADSLH